MEVNTARAEHEGIAIGRDVGLDVALRDTVGAVYTLTEDE